MHLPLPLFLRRAWMRWRARRASGPAEDARAPTPAADLDQPAPAAAPLDASQPSRSGLLELLADMRGGLRAATAPATLVSACVHGQTPSAPMEATGEATGEASGDSDDRSAPDARAVLRFHLAVDDGGEYFAVCGAEVVIGHLRSPLADLPFLADVEAQHARLVLRESFHSGSSWSIERMQARAIVINGHAIQGDSALLSDGDRVELAPNLAFHFRLPEAASASALLDLSSGCECAGATHVLLFAAGSAGRVRIGARRDRHIPVNNLDEEVTLTIAERTFSVHCAGGVRLLQAEQHAPHDVQPPAADVVRELTVECPPRGALDFVANARHAAKAPFGIALRPALELPRAGVQ